MRQGFTLSEVLITLSIVGVVAVLTIPGIMKNYRNRLYTAQLEKVYAQVADAAQAIMNDEHVDNFYETTAGEAITTINTNVCTDKDKGKCEHGYPYFLTKYFKAVKFNCKKEDKSGCASSTGSYYSYLNGTTSTTGMGGNYCIQTVSGATICASGSSCLNINVDVNGMAEPNMAGRDIFTMAITHNGKVIDYNGSCLNENPGAYANDCGSDNTALTGSASGCLNNVIQAGWKMEY